MWKLHQSVAWLTLRSHKGENEFEMAYNIDVKNVETNNKKRNLK